MHLQVAAGEVPLDERDLIHVYLPVRVAKPEASQRLLQPVDRPGPLATLGVATPLLGQACAQCVPIDLPVGRGAARLLGGLGVQVDRLVEPPGAAVGPGGEEHELAA